MSNLYIMHYGVGHDKGGHSGRYPWGSGKNKNVKRKATTKRKSKKKKTGILYVSPKDMQTATDFLNITTDAMRTSMLGDNRTSAQKIFDSKMGAKKALRDLGKSAGLEDTRTETEKAKEFAEEYGEVVLRMATNGKRSMYDHKSTLGQLLS